MEGESVGGTYMNQSQPKESWSGWIPVGAFSVGLPGRDLSIALGTIASTAVLGGDCLQQAVAAAAALRETTNSRRFNDRN